MKEDMVRTVFVKYLQNLGKSPKVKKKNVPGPDIVMDGKAYECKGSKFDKNTLFKQLISNSLQYSGIGIVVPWDALDCLFIHQLEALEVLIREDPYLERSIEIYTIAQENNIYFLYRWFSLRLLSSEVETTALEVIQDYVNLPPEEKEVEILEFLRDFNEKLRKHIRKIIIEKGRNPPNFWEAFNCVLNEV